MEHYIIEGINEDGDYSKIEVYSTGMLGFEVARMLKMFDVVTVSIKQ